MKKNILLLTAIFLALPSFSQTYFSFEGLGYVVLDEGTCEIDSRSSSLEEILLASDGKLVIPETAYNSDNNTSYKVTSIGWRALEGVSGLISVEIPNSVTSIGSRAFCRCSSLTSVKMPETLTSIGQEAFAVCTSLPSIEIPSSVTTIERMAFLRCESLSAINVSNENTNFSSIDGVLFDKEGSRLISFPCGKHCDPYKIPDTATSIDEYAFNYSNTLISVEMPNSVTSIGAHAFEGCRALTSVKLPDSLTSIELWAFEGCSALTSVAIPNSVTSIGEAAFSGCYSLTAVTLPNSLTFIEPRTFEICLALTSIEIPNSVISIADHAFYQCEALASVKLPNSLTSIGQSAFYASDNIKEIYYASENPIPAETNIFEEECYAGATLYLPEAGVSKAASVEPWCLFNSIKAYDFNGVEEITADVVMDAPMETYTLEGVRITDAIEALPTGIYVIRQNGKVRKIAVK